MIDIRSNRLHKNRKKTKPLVLAVKVFAIGYMTFSAIYYFSGSTNASFSDTETVNAGFVANWDEEMDKPVDANALKITAIHEQDGNLIFTFKNMNDQKIENLDYQLYFSEEHSPKKGTKLLIGSIKDLKPAEEKKLVLKAAKGAGKYILKVILSKDAIVWSDEVIIQKTEEGDSAPDQTNENNQGAPPNNTNTPKDQEENQEPDKKEIDDEVKQQEPEKNSEKIEGEDNKPNQSDEVVPGATVDDEVSHSQNEQNNNE